tara:strand:- start:794 stop:976 length:183 start_codon:yes stop_codon:yes gene_type:complete
MERVERISITKGYNSKVEGGAYRKALIDLEMYSTPTHKVHKNKKKYNRKLKQSNEWKNIV